MFIARKFNPQKMIKLTKQSKPTSLETISRDPSNFQSRKDFKPHSSWVEYFTSKPQKLFYDKERIAKLALPREIFTSKKAKRKMCKSIDSSRLPILMQTLRTEKEKNTLQNVHQAFIYGVNLTQVPSLNEQFKDMRKHLKDQKHKKDFRKTMKYFKKIDKINRKLLLPLP